MCPGPKEVPSGTRKPAKDKDAIIQKSEKPLEGVDDFYWSYTDEPHKSRRDQIMSRYPDVKQLNGPCALNKFKASGIIFVQLLAAVVLRDAPWPLLLLMTYSLGGSCNHFLTLAMHEVSHNLAFRNGPANRIFSIIVNLPLGIPAAISFKRYHMEHHKYQGDARVDVDLPTAAEGRIFRGTLLKLLFMFLMPAFYSLRPLCVRPKRISRWELVNIAAQVAFDVLIYATLGGKSLFYFIVGTLLGMGIHPMAGHFIAEHFVYQVDQETYSYYGPLNWLSLNVGYHNEHHDFPYVPGSRLHSVRKLAPEFYMEMPHYYSWVKVIWDFVTDPAITPFNRVKRSQLTEADIQALAGRD